MISRPSLSSLVSRQLPEFVREDHQTFVAFLEAYYSYLDSISPDPHTLRDLDVTLDSFVHHFKNELAVHLPKTQVDERWLLQHIKDQYLTKGAEPSFKLLFRLLFNKEVTVEYPSKQLLRASDGKWNKDVSIICEVTDGSPDDIIGKMADIHTQQRIIRVLVDRRQYIEVEVERVVQLLPNVYEFYIDRRFFGEISIGDTLRYRNDIDGIYFSSNILATTAKLKIITAGTGFKIGQLYSIKNGQGTGSIIKVTRVTSVGGIIAAEFIKFGVGYVNDFTSTLYADASTTSGSSSGSTYSIVGDQISITETTDGFSDYGQINTSDYAVFGAIDGTYAGVVIREFNNEQTSIESLYDPAIIKVDLGALAQYPGYYVSNDGFLNDAIFIQDSHFYQAFSYVLKIDERLDTYKSAVKSLLHPAGMALFGEYDIRNEFDLGLSLEAMVKALGVTVGDTLLLSDTQPLFSFGKLLEDSSVPSDAAVIAFSKFLEDSSVPSDAIDSFSIGKLLEDSQGFSDAIESVFSKGLEDIPVITELAALSTTKYIDDSASPVDSGGYLILNPYAEAGWFLEDYVGEHLTF